MQGLLPVLFIIIAVAVAVFAWQAEKKRRQALAAWAAEHGWSYSFRRDKQKVREFGFLQRLQQGHGRSAFHRLSGEWEGRPAEAFQLRYTTGSGKNQQTHWWVVTLIRVERPFPELTVAPENMLSRFGQALGFDDIDFESVEFSNAYAVRSRDKKFAYDFCNTGMMEHLLAHRGTSLELEHNTMALLVRGRLKPGDLGPALNHLGAIRGHIPDYVFRT